jgi:DNA processing protein
MGLQPMARHFPMRNRLISGMSRATVVVEAAAKSGSLITARGALDQGREVLAVPGHPLDARAAGCNILIRDGARLVRHIDDIIEALPPLDLATEGPQAEFDLALPESTESTKQPDPATLAARSGATGATVGSGNGMQEHGQPFDHANQPANDQPNAVQQALEQAARLHRRILDRLGPSPLSEDDLMRDLRDLGRGGTGAAPVLTELELQGEIQRQPGGFIARSH